MFSHSRKIRAAVDDFRSEHVQHKIDGKQSVASENGIPFFHSTMFACLLEDCLTQLRILSECNNEQRILKTYADMGHLLTLKYHLKQEEQTDDLDNINRKELGSNQYKLNKLFADRKYLADVLQQTYLDMALDRCFSSLTASIQTIEDRDEYRAKLAEEESRNKTTRRDLIRHLRQQRNHIKSVIYDTNLTMENLKFQVEDTELNSETRSRYIESWQRARNEQHVQTILDKESGPAAAIQYFQNRSDQEHRVHSEVELLVNIVINETLTKVENWMNKFDLDMEAQDLLLAKMKNKFQDATEKRKELEETYASHEKLMKEWIQFKADRQKALDYREKMTKSALIVQAWWRGLLVRLQLGEYRPKKKSKAAKKKK